MSNDGKGAPGASGNPGQPSPFLSMYGVPNNVGGARVDPQLGDRGSPNTMNQMQPQMIFNPMYGAYQSIVPTAQQPGSGAGGGTPSPPFPLMYYSMPGASPFLQFPQAPGGLPPNFANLPPSLRQQYLQQLFQDAGATSNVAPTTPNTTPSGTSPANNSNHNLSDDSSSNNSNSNIHTNNSSGSVPLTPKRPDTPSGSDHAQAQAQAQVQAQAQALAQQQQALLLLQQQQQQLLQQQLANADPTSLVAANGATTSTPRSLAKLKAAALNVNNGNGIKRVPTPPAVPVKRRRQNNTDAATSSGRTSSGSDSTTFSTVSSATHDNQHQNIRSPQTPSLSHAHRQPSYNGHRNDDDSRPSSRSSESAASSSSNGSVRSRPSASAAVSSSNLGPDNGSITSSAAVTLPPLTPMELPHALVAAGSEYLVRPAVPIFMRDTGPTQRPVTAPSSGVSVQWQRLARSSPEKLAAARVCWNQVQVLTEWVHLLSSELTPFDQLAPDFVNHQRVQVIFRLLHVILDVLDYVDTTDLLKPTPTSSADTVAQETPAPETRVLL